MNKIFKAIFFTALCAAFLVAVPFIPGCLAPESESLGSITLASSGSSDLAVRISASHGQPYRLLFDSPGTNIDKLSEHDSLEVFLENNDAVPLIVYLASQQGDVVIAPKSSASIFRGTFKELLSAGRDEHEDLTIASSRGRKVNATFKFVRLSGGDALTIKVSTWRIHYGF